MLALPRGGVPVGAEIAKALGTPLDVFVVRKLGTPGQEELAFGALASGGTRILDPELIRYFSLPQETIQRITEREQRELERRELLYRKGRDPLLVRNRTVIVVDDGLATGASMLAAAKALREQGAAHIVVAVPVGARQSVEELQRIVDHVTYLATPHPFNAVGIWYDDFSEVTDEEVQRILEATASDLPAGCTCAQSSGG